MRAVVLLVPALLLGGVALAEPPAPSPATAPSPEVALVRQWTDFAATAGPFGVIVVMGYVIRVLWQENKAKDASRGAALAEKDAIIKARDETVATIQQKRVDEGIENARRVTEVATQCAGVIQENVRTTAEYTSIIRALKESGAAIAPALAEVSYKLDRNMQAINGGKA